MPPPGTAPLVVASALMHFLRTLPEPIFTFKYPPPPHPPPHHPLPCALWEQLVSPLLGVSDAVLYSDLTTLLVGFEGQKVPSGFVVTARGVEPSAPAQASEPGCDELEVDTSVFTQQPNRNSCAAFACWKERAFAKQCMNECWGKGDTVCEELKDTMTYKRNLYKHP